MIDRTKQATLFAIYQLSIALGIVLLPLAVALDRVGLTLPVHRIVERIEAAHESVQA